VIPAIVEAMRAALDAHDVDAYVDFFREDFVGERPRHPGVEVRGRDEVRESWSEIIEDVPDMRVRGPGGRPGRGHDLERVADVRHRAERGAARDPRRDDLRRP
jgi:hypothetical protein